MTVHWELKKLCCLDEGSSNLPPKCLIMYVMVKVNGHEEYMAHRVCHGRAERVWD